MTYLDIVKRCDSVPYPEEQAYQSVSKQCFKFLSHNGVFLGWVLPIVAKELIGFDAVIKVDNEQKTITLSDSLTTVSERSETLSRIINDWRKRNAFECLKGWRDELYSVYNPSKEVYLFVERSAACLFGFVTYGVHIVGYVPGDTSEQMKIWVPQRSKTKQTHPGKLDNTVAGGIGYPHGILETALKECAEEAGLEESYVKQHLKPAGVVSYCFRHDDSLTETGVFQPEVEYIYDLPLINVIPKPVDGEVESFHLMTVDEVKQALQEPDRFKYNCALVQVDFFVRHGLVTAQDEPYFLEVLNRCHRRLDHPVM